MALLLPVLAALLLGLALGGRAESLARLRLRNVELFYVALGLQVVAYPFSFLPWHTPAAAAKSLWLLSYALLIAGAWRNRTIVGVPIMAAGMISNLAAVVVNGGSMPVRREAMEAAGATYLVDQNSVADSGSHLSWLIDRWAAPQWVPFGNVFSVGDVLIALGTFVVVLAGMGVGGRWRPAAERSAPPRTGHSID